MKTIAASDSLSLNDVLKEGRDEDIVVMRDGHAVAMVVPMDDEDMEWYKREKSPDFIKSIEQARQQIREGKSVTHTELKSGLKKK